MTVFIANTNMLTLFGLKSHVEDTFINDADVELVTITGKNGVPLDDYDGWPTFPVVMDHIEESDGDYRAILVDTIPFEPNKSYEAHIRADGGMNRIGFWRFVFKPEIRR